MHQIINTKTININNAKIGTVIRNYFLCIKKVIKSTKMRNKYLDVILKNSSGVVEGKVWNNVNAFINLFQINDIVAVKGVCEEFNGRKVLKISSINKVEGDYYNIYGYGFSDLNLMLLGICNT